MFVKDKTHHKTIYYIWEYPFKVVWTFFLLLSSQMVKNLICPQSIFVNPWIWPQLLQMVSPYSGNYMNKKQEVTEQVCVHTQSTFPGCSLLPSSSFGLSSRCSTPEISIPVSVTNLCGLVFVSVCVFPVCVFVHVDSASMTQGSVSKCLSHL